MSKFFTSEQEEFLIENYRKLRISVLVDGVSALQSGYRTKASIYQKLERLKEKGLIHGKQNATLEITAESKADGKAE